MTIREALLRVPIIGPIVERRWITDPIERDAHQALVAERLEAAPTNQARDPVEAPELPAE